MKNLLSSAAAALLAVALVASPADAPAAVLFEQGPILDALSGLQVDAATPPLDPAPPFTVVAGSTIQRITWWGYYGAGSGLDDAFDVLLGGAAVTGSLTRIGEPGADGALGLYRYTLDLGANSVLAVLAAQSLSVLNLGDPASSVEWYWQGSVDGGDSVAFLIEGELPVVNPVPEPVTAWLLLAGIAAGASLRRRAHA